jgi:hypothetical protein
MWVFRRRSGVHREKETQNRVGPGENMDDQQILMYGLIAAGLLVLWGLFKIVKKVILVILIVVAVLGIGFGLYLKFF